MTDVPEDTLTPFLATCHEIARRGLVRCSSGNLSVRIDDERMLLTSSRSWMERVTAHDLSICRLSDGSLIEGGKPSVETRFHAGVLRTRPEMKVVLHFQTPYATALACREQPPPSYFVIPEIPFYIGPVAHVPYIVPGSEGLANAVTEAMRDHDMVVMGNHGHVTTARDYDHVIQNAQFFELACSIIVNAGDELSPLSSGEVQELLDMRAAAQSVAV